MYLLFSMGARGLNPAVVSMGLEEAGPVVCARVSPLHFDFWGFHPVVGDQLPGYVNREVHDSA